MRSPPLFKPLYLYLELALVLYSARLVCRAPHPLMRKRVGSLADAVGACGGGHLSGGIHKGILPEGECEYNPLTTRIHVQCLMYMSIRIHWGSRCTKHSAHTFVLAASPEDDFKLVPLGVPAASLIRLFLDLGEGYSTLGSCL